MLIFSGFDNDRKFIEIKNIEECKYIESDCYAYINIDSTATQDLESYFKLGALLQKHEVPYAVVLSDYASCHINNFYYTEENTLAILKEQIKNDNVMQKQTPIYQSHEQLSQIVTADCVKTITKRHNIPLLPLKTILFMFAKHGASFFILDEKNYTLLPLAQNLANYYLLDIKILALVDSYTQLEHIAYWTLDSNFSKNNQCIGIDGVVEKNLLIQHTAKTQ